MTATTTKREYGLQIERRDNLGTEYVQVVVCARESDKDYPLGCSTDGESEYDSRVPKHVVGLMLDGLGMYGFVSDSADVPFIGNEVEYRDVFSIDLPKLTRMQRTLKRVVARMTKDSAWEAGDRLVALAKCLKLSFVVERTTPRGQRNPEWNWMSVEMGRNRYRTLIDQAREATAVRKGLKTAS
jgi:hypothetical protein